MKISRENYEIWFADWLDDKLSTRQQEELNSFLEENPDLKKEFDDITRLTLNPSSFSFPDRAKLKRSLSEMSLDQFELLCAASLEGDLEPGQISGLSEISANDSEKKRAADLMALTKLKPPALEYPFKKNLFSDSMVSEKPAGAIVVRFILPALAVAAVFAILIITGVFKKQISTLPETPGNTAQAPVFNSPALNAPSLPVPSSTPVRNYAAATKKTSTGITGSNPSSTVTESSTIAFEKPAGIVPVEVRPVMQVETVVSRLAEGPAYTPQLFDAADDERSRIGKFLARTFREKVLDEQAPSDKPLKGYEIAEAGITGINKLLGWEMALTKNTSDNGQTSSVNFNSRLLKFNTPVKNNEQGE